MATKRAYRRAFAKLIGPYYELTATSGSTTGAIECTQWPFYSNNVQNELLQDWFMFRPTATNANDMARLVPEGGYTPATGTITIDKDYTVNPYLTGTGELIEAHGTLDPGFIVDMLINEALKQTLCVVEVQIPAVPNVIRHKVSSLHSWLTEPKWIRQVGWLGPNENREQFDPYSRIVYGGGEKLWNDVYFVHRTQMFAADNTLFLKCVVPAYYVCRGANGEWGDQEGLSTGIVGETDEAIPQVEWVAWAALVEAWIRMSHVLDAQSNNRILRDADTAAKRFTELSQIYLDMPEYTAAPLQQFGPPI